MSSRAEWNEALIAAENGRPEKLAALTRHLPYFWNERLAAYIAKSRTKNIGRPVKRNANGNTEKREQQADAYIRYWELINAERKSDAEAIAITCREIPKVKPNVLEVVVVRRVKPVNEILRERGVI
jgi:hypothetical protein